MNMEKSFLTVDLASQVLAEFNWPNQYELFDEMPDGILMSFENSNFLFVDSASDGDVMVNFLPGDTGQAQSLHLGHAMLIIVPESKRMGGVITPGLEKLGSPFRTLKNTEIGLRNACKIILHHLKHVIEGDFSWVKDYLEHGINKRENQ